ncbi:hypothetical protein DJ564_06120 [Pseudomonas sp. 31-12]|nr:DUF1120 domain-containing protein [Pseudomonas sp. 31-12]AWM95100.1 hypothetical protein DJ564_06120 [Pseudomonas sp. 31-12]
MKKYFAALSATALISVAPYALAASSTDLTVTGTITPNACTPLLSEGGNVHHGKISSKDLNQDKVTNLAEKTLQFTVNCDSAIAFRLKPIDNRFGSATGSNTLGLGFVNGDQRLGSVDAGFYSPLADGVAVLPIHSKNNGDTWSASRWLEHNALFAFGAVADPSTPIAIKDLVTDLRVLTQIARADSLDLSNDAAIDGSVTIEIDYP